MGLAGAQIAVALAVLLGASGANAAQRYAGPESGKFIGDCPQSDPCRLDHAVEDAANGDEVIVLPGHHHIAGSIDVNDKSLSIHGVAGEPRPQVFSGPAVVASTDPPNALALDAAPGGPIRVSHLYFRRTGGTIVQVDDGTAILSDLVVEGDASGNHGFHFGETARGVVRDSVARVVGSGTAGLSSASPSLDLRNVTAVGVGPSSQGIRVLDQGMGTAPAVITARNVIARGEHTDVRVASTGSFGAVADMAFSNFRNSVVTGGGAALLDSGHNQSAPPLFANEGLGDYHQLPGSPTIDGGTDDALNGATDIDGEARHMGAAPDIGADEVAASGGPGPGPGAGTQSGAPDRTSPVITRLRVRPRGFRARRGARVGYVISERASATFRVRRRAGGRWVAVRGTLRRVAARGGNGFRFRGRIGRHRLRPGRYLVSATAVDAAGNRSKRARTRFRIVR